MEWDEKVEAKKDIFSPLLSLYLFIFCKIDTDG